MRGRSQADAGFMMVDAMIGVAIIALSLTLCLSALRIARHSREAARRTDAARLALVHALATAPSRPGSYQGRDGDLATDVTVTSLQLDRVELCQLDATVTQGAPHKIWRMTATRWCEPSTS